MKLTDQKTSKAASVHDSSGDVFIGATGGATTSATPTDVAINAVGGSGTNIAGADLSVNGGRPTGSGAGGSVILKTAPAGATGTTARTLVNRLEADQHGVIWLNAVSTAPTVGVAGKVGLFVQAGVLKAILPDNSVEIVAYDA